MGHIPYIDSEGKQHHYIPDFKVGDQLIEIKGSQFFDRETGAFVNPFDRSFKMDRVYESKYKCMVENRVKIPTKEDLKEVFEYIEKIYGKDFLRGCLKKNII